MTLLRPSQTPGISLGEIGKQLGVEVPPDRATVRVTGVELDSKKIVPGDIFVALPGSHQHGASFGVHSERAGAVAILTDKAGTQFLSDVKLPVLVSERPRELLGSLAAEIYGSSDSTRLTFGITGTNITDCP